MSYLLEDDASIQNESLDRISALENARNTKPSSTLNLSERTSGVGRIIGTGTTGSVTDPLILSIVEHGTIGLVSEVIDLSVIGGNFHKMELNEDIEIDFSLPPVPGKVERFILEIKQDAIGGHAVLTWPPALVNPPTIETSSNGYTRVEFYTSDGGTTYHALSVTTGVGGSALWSDIAIDITKDMLSFGLTNLGTIVPGTNKDVGSELNPWRIMHATKYEFNGTPNSSPSTLSDTLIQLGSFGQEFNVDLPTEDYRYYIDGTLRARLYMSGLESRFDVDQINSNLFLLDETGVDPGIDGIFSLNTGDVKVMSGGVVRNLSDISAGSGPEFQDDVFRVFYNMDNTRKLAFQTGGITTLTTRTVTIQNASGTMALLDGGLLQQTSNAWEFNDDFTLERTSTHPIINMIGNFPGAIDNDLNAEILMKGLTTGTGGSIQTLSKIRSKMSRVDHATRASDLEFVVIDGSTQGEVTWFSIDGDNQRIRLETITEADSIYPNNPGDVIGNNIDPWFKIFAGHYVMTNTSTSISGETAIGSDSSRMWFNQTILGNRFEFLWDDVLHYSFGESTAIFGTTSNPIAIVLDATNQASISKAGSTALDIISSDGVLFESGPGAGVGQIMSIRGDLGVNNLVGAQIVFQDDNSVGTPTDYGSIRSRVLNNLAGAINSSMEFYVFDINTNQLKFEINGDESKIKVWDRMEMQTGQVFSIEDQYLEIRNTRSTPGQSGDIRRLFLNSANSGHATLATPSGLVDLEAVASGGTDNFSIGEVIQTTDEPSQTNENYWVTSSHSGGNHSETGSPFLQANGVYAVPIVIGKNVTAKEIGVRIGTGQSDPLGRMDLGIYTSRTDGTIYPETLIASSSGNFVASTGFLSVSINRTLTPGLYFLAMTVDNVSTLEIDFWDSEHCHGLGVIENGSDLDMIVGYLDQGQSSLLTTYADSALHLFSTSGAKIPALYLRCE